MKKIILAKLLLFAVAIACFGQKNNPVNIDNDWEVWHDKVPVSGEIRVGIMTNESSQQIDPTSFYVLIPKHNEKYLNCEISSKDGRYEGSVSYDISKLSPGIHQFSLPTSHINELKNYTSKDITILTTIENNDSNTSKIYASASWEPIEAYPEFIFIYINSGRKTSIVIEGDDQNERMEFPCEKISSDVTIAYNSKCKIPINNLKAKSTIYLKQRVRKMNKITFNSYPITLKIPLNEKK